MYTIPFNKPYVCGTEMNYIEKALKNGKLSGNGLYTQKCQDFFSQILQARCLLTTSCTDALEMSAILADIQSGDEVIMPSYTFVSTANAFILRGAKISFVDSLPDSPCMDTSQIEAAVTPNTRAIVVVHYGGIACDMDEVMAVAEKYNLLVIEDAAQAVDAFYKGRPLGSIGDMATFSFHETKNLSSGEGGLLAINNPRFEKRAEIIWEKGTNRSAFFRGESDKYNWVDIGSSFLPSEITACFLYAQLQELEKIQSRRKEIWNTYQQQLQILADKKLIIIPSIPDYATNNGHVFYILCPNEETRSDYIKHMKENGIYTAFHYLGLHNSPYIEQEFGKQEALPHCEKYAQGLVRLPLFMTLSDKDQQIVIDQTLAFFGQLEKAPIKENENHTQGLL